MRLRPTLLEGETIVIIIGAGFAGMQAAKSLAGRPLVRVILIDSHNHHLFQPLLYQVATAGLDPSDIAVPIRAQFPKTSHVEVHMGKAQSINLSEKYVVLGDYQIEFDYLIVACGTLHSYFGKSEWENYAPGLKTLEQATEIRRRVLSAFELAESEIDPKVQKALLTFVIVGGGPTGVELAGAISDISRTVLVRDFRRINPSKACIVLVEAAPKIMNSFADDLASRAHRDLESLGVEVRVSSRVENINSEGVQIGSDFLPAKTVLWAAGVRAAPLAFTPATPLDRFGRVVVEKDFSVPSFPYCFVVGDMASFEMAPQQFLPGLAPAAIQSGAHAAKSILASIAGRPRQEFVYKDKGQMATIGKHLAIAQAGRIKLTGLVGWLAWLFVHVFYLITFRNRISVMVKWAWSYTFSKRGARLITEQEWLLFKEDKK
jgi:NADH dehydrogenase